MAEKLGVVPRVAVAPDRDMVDDANEFPRVCALDVVEGGRTLEGCFLGSGEGEVIVLDRVAKRKPISIFSRSSVHGPAYVKGPC